MKVYIAQRMIEWEGFEVMGIYAAREDAEKRCLEETVEICVSPHGEGHAVEEYELELSKSKGMKIPENEQENVLSLFWQMLSEIESRTHPETDVLNKSLVEGGFEVMQRIGVTTGRPRWVPPLGEFGPGNSET